MGLITQDRKRTNFSGEYVRLKKEGKVINTREELDKAFNEEKIKSNPTVLKDITPIYHELVNQNNEALRSFLNAGAIEILARIEMMEEHIRALDTTKPLEKETERPSSQSLLNLLWDGDVSEFNKYVNNSQIL